MLKVEDLSKSYRTGDHVYPVLKNLSLQVEKGEFVAVMGPSGSGKTTLLNCISCFIPHDSGKIFLNGKDLSGLDETGLAKVRNQNLGFVFQDFMLLDGLTVFENYLYATNSDNANAQQKTSVIRVNRFNSTEYQVVTRVDKGGALHIYHQRRQPTGGEGAGTDGMWVGSFGRGAVCGG